MQKVEEVRRGYVLVAVLLLLLAVTGVGHTLLVMTRSEFFVSQARWDMLARRFAAETGRDLTARGMTRIDSLPRGEWVSMGSVAVPPRARYEARAVRLSREVLLIHSEGWLDTGPGRDRQVGLYWAMDPVARFAAARGVLESGGPARVEAGSMVDATLIHEAPAMWPEAFLIVSVLMWIPCSRQGFRLAQNCTRIRGPSLEERAERVRSSHVYPPWVSWGTTSCWRVRMSKCPERSRLRRSIASADVPCPLPPTGELRWISPIRV